MSPGVGARQQIFASWLESLGAFGVAVGFPSWTGDEPISRHPSGAILDGLAAHDAFKAADLASSEQSCHNQPTIKLERLIGVRGIPSHFFSG
jgi:hypothetical protein